MGRHRALSRRTAPRRAGLGPQSDVNVSATHTFAYIFLLHHHHAHCHFSLGDLSYYIHPKCLTRTWLSDGAAVAAPYGRGR